MNDRLASYLLERGKITHAELQEAGRTQGFFGGEIETHLLTLGYVDETAVATALSDIFDVPYVGDRLRTIRSDVAGLLPRELVERHSICPIELDGAVLRIATRNPRDVLATAAVRKHTGREPDVWVTSEPRLRQAMERLYGIRNPFARAVAVVDARKGRTASPTGSVDAPSAARTSRSASEEPELGLDGLPIDAEVSFDAQGRPQSSGLFGVLRGPDDRDPLAEAGAGREASSGDTGGTAARPAAQPSSISRSAPAASSRSEAGASVGDTLSTLGELESALLRATDRDAIAEAVVEFLRSRASRVALFAVGKTELKCLAGRGRAFGSDRLRRVRIPRHHGGLLDEALERGDFYLGGVPPLPSNKDLFSLLGGRLPPMAMTVPVWLKGRVVGLLYLDNDTGPIANPDVPLLRRIATKTSLAFEILLLRAKLADA